MYGFTINVEGNAVGQMKIIEAELAKLGVVAKVEAAKVESSFAGIGKVFGSLKGMLLGGLGITAAFAGWEFIKASHEAFDKLEDAVSRVKTVIGSTKGAAGLSVEDVEDQAKAIGKGITNGRAAIMDAQAMLLSFTGIKGPIFEHTTKAVADFAQFYKTDMTSAALQIGKALNNPLTGMNRLQRVGVAFTEQQKEQIKNYTAQGNLLAAQGVILKELDTEFGGQAKAFALTDEGKVVMAKKKWGELKLTIGELVSKLQVSVIPLFSAMMAGLSSVIAFFKGASTEATIFKDILLVTAGVLVIYYTCLGIVAAYTKIVAAATWAWDAAMAANPITWVIAAVIALIVAFMVLWDKCEKFRRGMGGIWETGKKVVEDLVFLFKGLGQVISDAIHGNFKKSVNESLKLMSDMKTKLTTGWKDAWEKGATGAEKSDFRFEKLLKFGTGQEGSTLKGGAGGKDGGNAGTQSAINTSALSGAKGGLGEAKVINIRIDTMQKVEVKDGNGLKEKSQDAIEILTRTLNNLAYSQGSSM